MVSFPEGVLERFPDDEMVARLRLDSYLAVALRGADGEHLGHLGVLASTPLRPDDEKLAALRIFAARAAAELERRCSERVLRDRERAHRALAEEQAALRRVAILVAAGAPQQEVLDRVVAEAGPLLEADVASLVRADGHRGRIVAGWSAAGAPAVPVGRAFDLETAPLTRRVLRDGRSMRADEPELRANEAFKSEVDARSAAVAPIDVAGRKWGVVRAARTGATPLRAGAEARLGDLIDTADSYGPEVSERLIAEALHPYPDDLLVATKGGLTRPGGRWVPDGRPEHLHEACEGSRVGSDGAHRLYQLHRPDSKIAFEDSVWALAQLRDQGKIRHVGLSNVGVRELEIALDIVPVASVQNRYNLSDRSSEAVLQACEREGVGFMPWYPLATGRLARPGDPSTRSPSSTTPPHHRWRSPGSSGTRPRCCPSQVPRRSRTLRRTWLPPGWFLTDSDLEALEGG